MCISQNSCVCGQFKKAVQNPSYTCHCQISKYIYCPFYDSALSCVNTFYLQKILSLKTPAEDKTALRTKGRKTEGKAELPCDRPDIGKALNSRWFITLLSTFGTHTTTLWELCSLSVKTKKAKVKSQKSAKVCGLKVHNYRSVSNWFLVLHQQKKKKKKGWQ